MIVWIRTHALASGFVVGCLTAGVFCQVESWLG
jgi:hypothetical protein